MKRVGYQIYKQGGSQFSYWKPHGPIFMSRKEAERQMSTLSFLYMDIKEVEVIEDESSIDFFYRQIELEDPEYDKQLKELLEEFKDELANPRKITEEEKEFYKEDGSLRKDKIKDWLYYLSKKI